jgi:hypothetical protein
MDEVILMTHFVRLHNLKADHWLILIHKADYWVQCQETDFHVDNRVGGIGEDDDD